MLGSALSVAVRDLSATSRLPSTLLSVQSRREKMIEREPAPSPLFAGQATTLDVFAPQFFVAKEPKMDAHTFIATLFQSVNDVVRGFWHRAFMALSTNPEIIDKREIKAKHWLG